MRGAPSWLTPVLLVALILLQLMRVTAVFESREDFHLDECWSYGFANSYYDGYIARVPVDDYATVAEWDKDAVASQNFNEWTSSEVLRDFLTVQPDERFDYASVIASQKYDLSPPFHSILLYTICSFFPDTFSWWYAYAINIVAFIGAQICLFLIGRRLLKSKWLALLLVALYGFSMGAVNCFVYLRPYALLTFLTLLFCWINLLLFDRGYRHCGALIALLGIVTFLGCYTNIYFLLFAFAMTVGVCIHLIRQRRWKALFAYGFAVLAGAVCMLLACIPMFSSLQNMSTVYSEAHGRLWRMVYCFSILFGESTGAFPAGNLTGAIVFFLAALAAVIFCLSWICREKKNSARRAPSRNAVLEGSRQSAADAPRVSRIAGISADLVWFSIVIAVAFSSCYLFIANSVNVASMGLSTDRYVSFLMPFTCLFTVWIANLLAVIALKGAGARSQAYRYGALTLLVAVLTIAGALTVSCHYIFPMQKDFEGTVESLTADSDVILVTDYDWSLTYWSSRLMGSDEFFACMFGSYSQHDAELDAIDNDKPVYLILAYPKAHQVADLDYVGYYAQQPWADQCTYIGSEVGFTDDIEYIYRLR